jgi:mannose-6-phosphate isomerase-like protein (cupin superfamily)
METTTRHLHRIGDGKGLAVGGFSAHRLVEKERAGGNLAIMDHILQPRWIGAPLHTHAHTVEISIVISGRIGVQIGNDELVAEPGEVVVKPAGVPHAFWNPGLLEARFIEILTPPDFADYFDGLEDAWGDQGPVMERLEGLMEHHDIELDPSSLPVLIERHGLLGP